MKTDNDEFVAARAKPRHRGPSLEEGNLAARQEAYNRLPSNVKESFHKPGSLRGHKS
jgi:hypothetical protein